MRNHPVTRAVAAVVMIYASWLWLVVSTPGVAQQPAERPRAVGGRPEPGPEDNTGFTPIFDGRTLDNWDGEPGFWRVENGAIMGETTAAKSLKQNTFLIWRGGTPKDFELKFEYRVSKTEGSNSGINFRSVVDADAGKWVMKGYQANIDGADRFSGEVYEERARGLLAPRGTVTRVAPDGRTKLLGSLGDADALKKFIKSGDWNQFHVIARGTSILQLINGHMMSVVVDDDPAGRAMEGVMGLQLHAGPPMRIEFRSILLKTL